MLNSYQNKLIEAWLNSENVSDDLKKQIESMSDEQKEQAFKEDQLKFGTAGYRAIMGPGNHYLNEITYKQLAYGYAEYLKHYGMNNKDKKIVVVSDNRLNYVNHIKGIINVLKSFDYEVIVAENFQPFPTPILSYVIRETNAIGAINITASHNPKEYNGIKFYNGTGSQLLPNEDLKLIQYIPDSFTFLDKTFDDYTQDVQIIDQSIIDKYFSDIISCLKLTKANDFKEPILFSSMHGTSSNYMTKFLKSLDYNIIDYSLHNFINSEFINAKNINPESFEAFKDLIEFAEKLNIKYIIATDPDADRLGFCYKRQNEWILLDGNRAGIIQTNYLMTHKEFHDKKPAIISTYVSNNFIDLIAQKYNANVYRTATGFKWIANAINNLDDNEEFVIGFEEAIGALDCDINREKDSFQVAGLLLEILKSYQSLNYDFTDILEKEIYAKYKYWYGITISKIIKSYNWKEVSESYINLLSNYSHKNIVSRNIEKIQFNEQANCLEFILENNSWIKFRISGTEPKFKIYFNLYYEGISKNKLASEIDQELKQEIDDILDFIELYLQMK
ncbi:MAG: phospho-sugar mutase [Ureaplasma sp.]|nr:phospho-sugar mutase [Ureaplasma sp.]